MRQIHFMFSVKFLSLCSVLASNSVFAQEPAPSRMQDMASRWIILAKTDLVTSGVKFDEIAKLENSNILAPILRYHPEYDEELKLSGSYTVSRVEINCAGKTMALRHISKYSLSGTLVSTYDFSDGLSWTPPETLVRIENDGICSLANSGLSRWSIGYLGIRAFIDTEILLTPPKASSNRR